MARRMPPVTKGPSPLDRPTTFARCRCSWRLRGQGKVLWNMCQAFVHYSGDEMVVDGDPFHEWGFLLLVLSDYRGNHGQQAPIAGLFHLENSRASQPLSTDNPSCAA